MKLKYSNKMLTTIKKHKYVQACTFHYLSYPGPSPDTSTHLAMGH